MPANDLTTSPPGMFVKEDWTLFRTLATLAQKAGVPVYQIAALTAKEVTDNGLDESGECRAELTDDNGFLVSDRGPGIPGDDAAVASLFSINRPLTSSKLIRMPTRGALGNGLRVVTGAVVATGGALIVRTGGRSLRLVHDHDSGDTIAFNLGPWDGSGTEVEVSFGRGLDVLPESLDWAEMAIRLGGRESYRGKTSPHWYSSDAFYELLQAAKGRTLRELVGLFEGFAGPKAARLARNLGLDGMMCRSLSRERSDELLGALRKIANPVPPGKLGSIGPLDGFENHARVEGVVSIPDSRGGFDVRIPVAVEAWTRPALGGFELVAFVNRSPITVRMQVYKDQQRVVLWGCNCRAAFGGNHKPFLLWFNVDTPYMPITSDGKAPDFGPFAELIEEAARKAAKKIDRDKERLREQKLTQKEVIYGLVPSCVAHSGGDGKYRFKQRQLFYAVRTQTLALHVFAPEYNWFCKVITAYENDFGEIKGMLRDSRGSIIHPHTGEEIELGTLEVEDYERPPWLFNKVVFIEKEGFNEILKDERWPERHDSAIMTSKGQGTRAAKDLIDKLAATGEPCLFFVIHDADAAGTMIVQCLQEATAARGARNVKIINLGLEPAEGRAMGLAVEDVPYETRQAVADYVPDADKEWLQHHRIELNAMTTPQFLAWLDEKYKPYAKLVPPASVLRERLDEDVKEMLRADITAEILEQAGIDGLVDEAFERLKPELERHAKRLEMAVEDAFDEDRSRRWTEPVKAVARKVANRRRRRRPGGSLGDGPSGKRHALATAYVSHTPNRAARRLAGRRHGTPRQGLRDRRSRRSRGAGSSTWCNPRTGASDERWWPGSVSPGPTISHGANGNEAQERQRRTGPAGTAAQRADQPRGLRASPDPCHQGAGVARRAGDPAHRPALPRLEHAREACGPRQP
jgi:hypothetical protein